MPQPAVNGESSNAVVVNSGNHLMFQRRSTRMPGFPLASDTCRHPLVRRPQDCGSIKLMSWLFEVLLDVVDAVTRDDRWWLRVVFGVLAMAAFAIAVSALFLAGA